ncbi:MAG TPA: molybdopterin oxidoreductase family protein, partial [Dongiaceae bacterium]|nr:molybdopterin oxidoreductase family protein [Dongiaceae bacterium]
ASNGSLFTAPGFKHRVKALQERGGKLVVLDPRRNETADIADQHFFVRPGTDALLLMAMLHTLFSQDLVDTGRLTNQVQGVNIVKNMVSGFSPQRVAKQVGMKAKDIRQLTIDFANAPRACLYGRMGVSTQSFGTLSTWLINLINILTGNLDEPGGVMFTRPAIDLPGIAEVGGATGTFNSRKSRVRKLPEFGGEFPSSPLADEILTEGKGQVKALITVAGNPVLSLPNGRRLEKALGKLDFMIAVDFYLNETTQHADIILPPTGPLEHGHYDLALNMVTVRNTAKYSPPLYQPTPDTRHDWEILLELTRRLHSQSPLKWAAGELQYQIVKRLGIEGLLDLLLRIGPYGTTPDTLSDLQQKVVRQLYKRLDKRSLGRALLDVSPFSRHTRDRNHNLTLKVLEKNPHGVDLGPLESCFPERLATQGKVINLVPNLFMKDITRLQKLLDKPTKQGPETFLLIGRRDIRSNNSWMHNSNRLVKGKNRCTALIHPDDAKRLGIHDGDPVVVSSRVGEIEIPAEITDKIMPGVISVPHGWGHNRAGAQLGVAAQHAGVSLNDITDERCVDAVTGVAAFSGQSVTVSRIKAENNVVRLNDKRLAASSAP